MAFQQKNIFEVGKTYSFNIYPTSIIADHFTSVTCTGLFDYQTAREKKDIDPIHAQVYPHLPEGIVDDPTMYLYVQFRMPDGSSEILGLPWINEATIVESSHAESSIMIEISGVSPGHLNRVRDMLVQNGYSNSKVYVKRNTIEEGPASRSSGYHYP